MTSSTHSKNSTSRNSTKLFQTLSTAWAAVGTYLQNQHQARQNYKAYALLLESDDKILRDIGVTRGDIRKRMNEGL